MARRADLARMARRADLAGIHDDIMVMPMGYTSLIGDMVTPRSTPSPAASTLGRRRRESREIMSDPESHGGNPAPGGSYRPAS
jgi:hypothetical protein